MNTKIKTKTCFQNWLESSQKKTLLKFLTCGSVDDGKSTLIGRLLYDTQHIYDDQLHYLKNDSKYHGTQGNKIDFSLLVDGLQSEREQGITIDVAYRYFSTDRRKFIIADTPGHEQYTRNMATGASTCDLSILLVDAKKGLSHQTYRHSFISVLMGIKYLIVAVNKMDLVSYQEEVFHIIKNKFLHFSKNLSTDLNIFFIPISALVGENIVFKNNFMPWYTGDTVLNILENINIESNNNLKEIRFPVQFVNRPCSNFRGYSGMLVSGTMYPGQEIKILPSNIKSHISRIFTGKKDLEKAETGQSITIVLKDEVDVSRGDFFVSVNSSLKPSREAIIDIVWMSENVLLKNQSYGIKLSGKKTCGYIQEVIFKIDINTFTRIESSSLELNSIGRIKFFFNEPVIFDNYNDNRMTGGIIFIDLFSNITVGGGMIQHRVQEEKTTFLNHTINFETELYSLITRYFPHWISKNNK